MCRSRCGKEKSWNMEVRTMTVFETVFLCLTIPLVYVFAYLAGKCDFLNVVCLMMQEHAKKLEEAIKDDPHT